MQRQIVVSISPQGEVEVKVVGVAGPSCREMTQQLEADLGEKVSDRTTSEFYQTDLQDQRQQTGR